MLVVSDTSPIRALSVLGLLDVLGELYGQVFIPPAVAAELAVPVRDLPAIDLGTLVSVRAPADESLATDLRAQLDPGEADAIALAVEMHADAVLIDEPAGRRVASGLGLHPIGVIGVLLDAKRRGLIARLAEHLDTLDRSIAFRISADLRATALRLAGE